VIDECCRKEFERALKTIEKQSIEIKKVTCELQRSLTVIGRQAYIISVLKNGLERLRYDNSWQGNAVNVFIDSLLEVVYNEK
jgi:hypothetical protein